MIEMSDDQARLIRDALPEGWSEGLSWESPLDDEVLEQCEERLEDLPVAKSWHGVFDAGVYSIDILGVPGAYLVRLLESDDEGLFETLEKARGFIFMNYDVALYDDWDEAEAAFEEDR